MQIQKKLMQRKQVVGLILLFMSVYFCNYLTRHNYGVVLVEILRSESFSKTAASAALTGMFVAYGLSQLLSGFLGDRIDPVQLIAVGLAGSSATNLLIPLCRTPTAMTAVWCVNGVCQAMCWPPMVRLAAALLEEQDYRTAVVRIGWGGYLGTIFLYLTSPLVIRLSGWRTVFFLCGGAGIVMTAVWLIGSHQICAGLLPAGPVQKQTRAEGKSSGGVIPRTVLPVMGAILLSIVLMGILRDGITSWMPTFISERFDLGSDVSILSGVFAPMLSIFVVQFAGKVQQKWVRNELLCAAGAFSLAAGACELLRLFSGSGPIVSTALFACAICCSRAASLYLTCMVPYHFGKTGRVSAVSGMLNAATYVGSAISSYGLAAVTERAGWNATLLVWLAAALTGVLLCGLAVRKWGRFTACEN